MNKTDPSVVSVSPNVHLLIPSGEIPNVWLSSTIRPVRTETPINAMQTPKATFQEGSLRKTNAEKRGVKTAVRLVKKPLREAGMVANHITCKTSPK